MFRIRRRRSFTHHAAYEGVLGTSLDIQVTGTAASAGVEVEHKILEEIDRLDSIFSTYRPDSEFIRWQQSQDEPNAVSKDLAVVLFEAETWRKASGGAFLPVVEELSRAWRRGEIAPAINPAEPMWEVDTDEPRATRLTKHAASLDAIAKGYIVDRAVESAMETPTITSVLVNIGGDLRHRGAGSITVSVTDPRNPADNTAPLQTVKVSNQAVATSGGYRRGFLVGGQRYSHIFDPKRAKPIEMLRSASVIAPTAMLADIFATIVGVLPPNEGLAFADRYDSVGALVVDDAGNCRQNAFWSRHIANKRFK